MVSWEQFTDMLSRDERIGKSHASPRLDGKEGFGVVFQRIQKHYYTMQIKRILNECVA